jgi:hypothetical protein
MNLGSHLLTNPLIALQNPAWKCHKKEDKNCYKKSHGSHIFNGTQLLAMMFSSRTEIQSKPFPDYGCTRIIQGKYKHQAESWQALTGRTHGQLHVP